MNHGFVVGRNSYDKIIKILRAIIIKSYEDCVIETSFSLIVILMLLFFQLELTGRVEGSHLSLHNYLDIIGNRFH